MKASIKVCLGFNIVQSRLFLLFVVFSLLPFYSHAAIFGDANELNGIEDDRITQFQAEDWPVEYRAVGRIICDEEVRGSAVLLSKKSNKRSEESLRQPIILTAKHVLSNHRLADCYFAPESYEWIRSPILSVFSESIEDKLTEQSIQREYEKDWIVFNVQPWLNWQKYALVYEQVSTEYQVLRTSHTPPTLKARMVGFDLLENQIVADNDCSLGVAHRTPLLNESVGGLLFWDDCDSEKGSSGGALFVSYNDKFLLVGIRVGTLFDRAKYDGKRPGVGGAFDLESFINVSRALPSLDNSL